MCVCVCVLGCKSGLFKDENMAACRVGSINMCAGGPGGLGRVCLVSVCVHLFVCLCVCVCGYVCMCAAERDIERRKESKILEHI